MTRTIAVAILVPVLAIFVAGYADATEFIPAAGRWLLSPIDQQRAHDIGSMASWHGRLMILAWAFLFPAGVLAARFFKIMPGQNWPQQHDNPTWWRTHLVAQYSGGIIVLVALWLIWQTAGNNPESLIHRISGWTAVGLCAIQFLAGWLRGSKGGPKNPAADGSWFGDHYDMTFRRQVFEYCHKALGYFALLVAAAAIVSGLWFTNAPHWMWIAIAAWWGVLCLCYAVLQGLGMANDTYQAIWGPDPEHPGNRMKPIGWGITRRR